MKKLRTILLMGLAVIIAVSSAIGGTLAYLTDTESAVNVMTVGNVDIVQYVQERDGSGALVDYVQFRQAVPAVGPVEWDTTPLNINGKDCKFFTPDLKNVTDNVVTVENVGKTSAFIRTIVAIEEPAGVPSDLIHISYNTDGIDVSDFLSVDIDGVNYSVVTFTYAEALDPGEKTIPSLLQSFLDSKGTNEDCEKFGDMWDIMVISQAVQADGFESASTSTFALNASMAADAISALNKAFGEVNVANSQKWFGEAEAERPVLFDEEITAQPTFEEFCNIVAEGGNIKITTDLNLTNPSTGRTDITLDKDVHFYIDDGVEIKFDEVSLFNGDGTLTIHGGSIKNLTEFCVSGDSTVIFEGGEHTFGAFSATGNGSIIINGGTFNCQGSYAGVMGISFAENGSLVVNDGLLNMYQPFNLNADRCDNAYIEINGGTVDLLNGIENLFVVRNIMDKDRTSGTLRGSSIRVNGGTFIAHYEIDSAGDATSFIRNGDSTADTNRVLVSNTFKGAPDYDCVVTGGTFYGSWQRADNTRYVDGNGGYSDGLMVDNSIAGFVADGYSITGDPTNGYVVTKD